MSKEIVINVNAIPQEALGAFKDILPSSYKAINQSEAQKKMQEMELSNQKDFKRDGVIFDIDGKKLTRTVCKK